MTPTIRNTEPSDIQGVVNLQRACFPPPFPEDLLWSTEHIERHLQVFPEGQFVAAVGRLIVGSATSMVLSQADWEAHRDWDATTGGHLLTNHDPEGTVLYGVDISVHPDWQGQGIGRALYQARFDLVRSLGLHLYGTVCRIPDYWVWSGMHPGVDQDRYCRAVVEQVTEDRTLTPLLKFGLRYAGVIYDHMDDEESGDAAAILEWTP